jgi:hypothetical protein
MLIFYVLMHENFKVCVTANEEQNVRGRIVPKIQQESL